MWRGCRRICPSPSEPRRFATSLVAFPVVLPWKIQVHTQRMNFFPPGCCNLRGWMLNRRCRLWGCVECPKGFQASWWFGVAGLQKLNFATCSKTLKFLYWKYMKSTIEKVRSWMLNIVEEDRRKAFDFSFHRKLNANLVVPNIVLGLRDDGLFLCSLVGREC